LLGALLNHAHAHPDCVDCRQLLELQQCLRFSHALPLAAEAADDSDLPMPVLHSWALAGGVFYDLALTSSPAAIHGQAPAFETDWKPADYVSLAEMGIRLPAELEADLIVRTAINKQTGAADEGMLFAMQCYNPGGTICGTDLTISAGTRNAELLACVRRLLPEALHSLGKTKAEAVELSLRKPFAKAWRGQLSPGDRIVLELHSDTALPIATTDIPPSGGAAALTEAYAKVFNELSNGSLRLSRHFSRQRYAGGPYLYNRFWKSLGRGYRPLLLTLTGSVFVLEVTDPQGANAALESWVLMGLPVGDHEVREGVAPWRLNPYRAQNGYGEVRIRHIASDLAEAPQLLRDVSEYRP
jgi:hypothetical protein